MRMIHTYKYQDRHDSIAFGQEATEMQYKEFMEKTRGTYNITYEEYTDVIEPFYLHVPSTIAGNTATEFCDWLTDNFVFNGSVMAAGSAMKSLGTAYDREVTKANELSAALSESEKANAALAKELEIMKKRLNALIDVIDIDQVKAYLSEQVSLLGMLDAYSGVKE